MADGLDGSISAGPGADSPNLHAREIPVVNRTPFDEGRGKAGVQTPPLECGPARGQDPSLGPNAAVNLFRDGLGAGGQNLFGGFLEHSTGGFAGGGACVRDDGEMEFAGSPALRGAHREMLTFARFQVNKFGRAPFFSRNICRIFVSRFASKN